MFQETASKPRRSRSARLTTPIAAALGVSILCGCVSATANAGAGAAALRAFLQQHVGWGPVADKQMRYAFARVSLNGGSRRQIFVYVTGPGWCGSGGCTAFLLQARGASFRVIDRFTLARLPIRILPSRSHGWHDLAMPVAGGGVVSGYVALLRFNGREYPGNPSTAPRLPAKLAAEGAEVELREPGSPVY